MKVGKRKSDQVLEMTEENTATSDSVSQKMGISRIHAANILKSLWQYGHLTRFQINVKEVGGRFYRFDISSSGINRLKWLRSEGRL